MPHISRSAIDLRGRLLGADDPADVTRFHLYEVAFAESRLPRNVVP